MLSLRFILSVVFFYELCEISQANTGAISAEYYKQILVSLNVSKLNFTTLNIVLERLKLDNCSANQPGCNKCLTSRHLYKVYGGHSENTDISYPWFQNLSTALLFSLLPEKNAGPKNCQHGAVRPNAHYRPFLKYYETSGFICGRFLGRILRDINETFKDSITKPCFSVTDLFHKVNLSARHDELDAEQFSTISIVVISYLLKRQCITLTTLDENDLELPCRSYFTSDLVGKFGEDDGYIPVNGFKRILENLEIGKSKGNGETHDDHDDDHDRNLEVGNRHDRRDIHSVNNLKNTSYPKVTQCYSSDSLFHIFDVNERVGFNSKNFKEICPALVQQVASKACLKEHIEERDERIRDEKYVWLYGFASVLVISLLSLAGIAVIPAMKGRAYKKIIIVLVGLAIGTLAGDALLHLIPHAAGFHAKSHGHDSKLDGEGKAFIWKFLVVASGVYGFFLFETFTHLFLRSDGHGHSHNIEHTRKHSPYETKKSCRNGENHEMHFVASTIAETEANQDNPEVSRNPDAISNKPNHDYRRDESPNLLGESSHGHKRKVSGVAWMIIIGDTIHNITDGIAIGAAFSVDIAGGLSTSIAVFCHELPHELGDFAVLISSGMTVKQAMLANFLSACSSFIGLIIGILIGEQTEEGSQWVFAIMGGMFLYIALVDMLPELMHSEELGGAKRFQIFILQNIGMLTGFVIMFLIAFFEEDLKLAL